MEIIEYLCYDGTISPEPFGLPPQIKRIDKSEKLAVLDYAKGHLEELGLSDEFWKEKILVHVLASRWVVSAAFVPENSKECRTLFVQKMNNCQHIEGFFAPYLGDAQRKRWGGVAMIPNLCRVKDDQSVLKGFSSFPPSVIPEMMTLYGFFLNDKETLAMVLTMQLPNESALISIGWNKV